MSTVRASNQQALSKLPRATLLTIGLATLINLGLFFVFTAAGLITASVLIPSPSGTRPLSAFDVVTATVVGTLVAVLVFVAIIRFRGARAERTWQVVGGHRARAIGIRADHQHPWRAAQVCPGARVDAHCRRHARDLDAACPDTRVMRRPQGCPTSSGLLRDPRRSGRGAGQSRTAPGGVSRQGRTRPRVGQGL